jgi:hypothetical protein
MKTSLLHYSLPIILIQPTLPAMMTTAYGPSDILAWITSTLFLNTTQVATVTVDPSVILTIDKDIEEYHLELKLIIDLQKEVQVICTSNIDYT